MYIFLGVLKTQKDRKLYDLVIRKVLIICNVQFMENEAWDGSIENKVIIIDVIENDDT